RTDFPILTCAVSRIDGAYRAAVGARPAQAMVLRDEQGLLAGGIGQASAGKFAAFAAERIPTGGNVRGSAAYRTHLVRVLTQRALLELGGDHLGN
ncbi:MAG: molybdopterin dehydrogenase, partial [Oscillospiraceae bacterium]|nr:molybdopterin dehydrogenase [Oscillospiraceae bacterium]